MAENTSTTIGTLFGILIGGVALFFLNPIIGAIVGGILGYLAGQYLKK
jgi:uncharacterized membrane protein